MPPVANIRSGSSIKGNDTAYVSRIRDREIVVVSFKGVRARSSTAAQTVKGNPNKMILNRDHSLLFVAEDNSDLVSIIDTKNNKMRRTACETTAPSRLARAAASQGYTGSNPNSLAFSPDERHSTTSPTANTSSVAVIGQAS